MSATVPAGHDPDRDQVVEWLSRLRRLEGVPFNYLVPDTAMLPPESIRFFRADESWLAALVDGAFGVATPPATDETADRLRGSATAHATERSVAARSLRFDRPTPEKHFAQSGFLLRSSVVVAWPGLEVHGFSDALATHELPIVRIERLSPTLLLCIFAGVVARLELREPAEALHFGVDSTDVGWRKELRFVDTAGGHAVGDDAGASVDVRLRGSGAERVLRVDELARAMAPHVRADHAVAPFTSAEFAVQMIEDVGAVAFEVSEPRPGT
ncbi:MAG TPA: hypothetical protein VIG64_04210 [Actinomycetota bacterium]|jgi:hypothetical protein